LHHFRHRTQARPFAQKRAKPAAATLRQGADGHEGLFNLRARAVTVAILRKLLNASSFEKENQELRGWLDRRRD